MKLIFMLYFYLSLLLCNVQNEQRIIGGQVARAGQFPFSAAIYKNTLDGNYFCGGALLTTQWIITAGQCVDGAILFTIYLGTNNIETPGSTSVRLATDEYVLHPEFNPLTLENDIGLIKLRMPVERTDYILPISNLPSSNLPASAGALEAIGWGQTSDNSELADELNWIPVTTVSNEECRITYGNQLTDGMVCIVGSFNEGACTGDTGSPLVQWIRGVYSTHVGISSFVSANGCESTDPSGYTRTYPYLSWIRNVTGTSQ
ncbi:brachyurin-like [Zophobas morio]|uniref:brachyurin-like n=1 Tax=Zophobas morio TaxID=2755281 RepID=UPI00308357B8